MAFQNGHRQNETIHDVEVSESTKKLLEQLTLEEKIELLSGRDFVSTKPLPRLNIPSIKVSDSTSAVKGSIFGPPLSTACFPNTAALAATWDRQLLKEMGVAIAGQARYKASQVVLGPTINIHRDPRGGRNFESFSEDPVLTGQLAVSLVNAIQSEGFGTCLKHFVCNESETFRKKYSANVDDRSLREIYMAPFQWILREARPLAIMTAYNRINGTYADALPQVNDVLRGEWGYRGLIMSDWFGTRSAESALEAGLDLEMPGPSVWRTQALVDKVKSGKVSQKLIDERTTEVLKFIQRTADVHSDEPEQAGEDAATNALARKVAAESMVLLKNENNTLPLNISNAPKIALIGQLAQEYSGGGGSAGGIPQYRKIPVECIKKAHPQPDQVVHEPGVPINRMIPMLTPPKIKTESGKPGVDIKFYNDGSSEPVIEEYSPVPIVFMLGKVKDGLKKEGFSYTMTTTMKSPSTGNHIFAVTSTGSFKLFVNGKEVMSHSEPTLKVEDYLFMPWVFEHRCNVPLTANETYTLRLEVQSRRYLEVHEPTPHCAKLGFFEEYSVPSLISSAAKTASDSDVSIVFAGRFEEWESEGSDLADLSLPAHQTQLIQEVAKSSPKTIVVLYGGNPFDISEWVDQVDAVIFAHYPGQEGASALTDILTGIVNPSGKLPMTWPMSLEDTPTYNNFPARETESGIDLDYKEGLKMGYRYYWNASGQGKARYDFGYGLSYTSFEYSDLNTTTSTASDKGESTISVKINVKNSGSTAGAETVQVYISPPSTASVWRPAKELKGFEKVYLEPGQSQTVTVDLVEKYAVSYWDEKSGQWTAEKGAYEVVVGGLESEVEIKESYGWKGL